MPHWNIFSAFVLFFFLSLTSTATTQQQETISVPDFTFPVKVGVYAHPPFVIRDGDKYGGMAIELWERLAAKLDIKFEYYELQNVGALVDATQAGVIDVAVTNITVTRERVERIDFTQPWFDAGQRIMISTQSTGSAWDVIKGLNETGHLRAYGWLILVIITATFCITLFDRQFDKNFPRSWRDGIAESFYTVMSVATSGKPAARKNLFGWIGRIFQGVWLVCGIAVLAYVTSSITSVMTTLSLSSQIKSVADLSNRTIGVQPGSVSEVYAKQHNMKTQKFEHIEQAVEALLNGNIGAIIGDAPVLEYYAHTNSYKPISVIGPLFEPDKYAFGLTHGSKLTRPLTIELVGTQESGDLAVMRARYFGNGQ